VAEDWLIVADLFGLLLVALLFAAMLKPRGSSIRLLTPEKSRKLRELKARAGRELGLGRDATWREMKEHGYIVKVDT
jgi:hypothetical protein